MSKKVLNINILVYSCKSDIVQKAMAEIHQSLISQSSPVAEFFE